LKTSSETFSVSATCSVRAQARVARGVLPHSAAQICATTLKFLSKMLPQE
jgi:hypothetical protein